MQARSIPSVTLYIRITDEKGNRRYERVNRRKPQLSGGIYCLHFYTLEGKRKWTTVGTDINAALKARMEKESELLTRPVEAKPSSAAPKPLEVLRTAFIHDKKTTFKKDGFPLGPRHNHFLRKGDTRVPRHYQADTPRRDHAPRPEGLDREAAGTSEPPNCLQSIREHRLLPPLLWREPQEAAASERASYTG